MKKLIKYTGDKTYMFPNGSLATPEKVLQQFESVLTFVHVVETDENEEVLFAVENLSALRGIYGIDPSLSENEAIAEIQTVINTVPEVDDTPSADERIAAALEYQNLLAMDDATTTTA